MATHELNTSHARHTVLKPQGTGTINFGPPPKKAKRKYICRTCSKAFKRSEHRIRHERAHTNEKPYSCEHCQKRYSRRDLLVRHHKALHPAKQLAGTKEQQERAADDNSPDCLVDDELGEVRQDSFSVDSGTSYTDFPLRDTSSENVSVEENAAPPNLIDPLLYWSSHQMADFALPPLVDQFLEGFSPLDDMPSFDQGYDAPQLSMPSDFAFDVSSAARASQPIPPEVAINVPGLLPKESPNNHAEPQVIKHKCTTTVVHFTKEMCQSLFNDLKARVSPDTLALHPMEADSITRYLQRYIEVFHTHLPMFHPSTLDVPGSPSPLILSMCAIGAIFRLQRKAAAVFFNLALQSLGSGSQSEDNGNNTFLRKWIETEHKPGESETTPLWISQTRLLLTVFATLSGDSEVSAWAMDQLGFFARDFRTRSIWLQSQDLNISRLAWRSWIERESVKRLLYGYMYLCNLHTLLFGFTAGFSIFADGQVEMPCHHALWDAPDEGQWRILAKERGYSSPLKLRDAVSRLLNGSYPRNIPEKYWEWDPYSCHVAVNAVSIYISHIVQGSYFLDEDPGSSETHSFQRTAITKRMETAIDKCLMLIKHARARADDSYTWDETEGPLLFNSLALLRVSYCKIMTQAESVCRSTFFRENEADIEASINSFLSAPLEQNKFLTRAISVALEGVMIPARVGSLLVKKTAAFTWAIEHALAGWDSILLLTKWIHLAELRQHRGVPEDDMEKHVMKNVRDTLLEEDESATSCPSLAAALARSWSDYYDGTWVWGITPRMGHMLRELANRYEAEVVSSHNRE